MQGNDYGGLIAPWKVRLIVARAKRLGFRDDEIPDLQQQIVPGLLEATFAPDRVGGASEETFVITMIDRQLVNVKRDRMRDRRRANSEALSLDADLVLSEKDLFARHCWDVLELQIDVRDVLEALTPAERAICKALAEGHSQADIARTMGRSKAAISNEVHKLRGKFRCLGLADYLEIDKDDIFT